MAVLPALWSALADYLAARVAREWFVSPTCRMHQAETQLSA